MVLDLLRPVSVAVRSTARSISGGKVMDIFGLTLFILSSFSGILSYHWSFFAIFYFLRLTTVGQVNTVSGK